MFTSFFLFVIKQIHTHYFRICQFSWIECKDIISNLSTWSKYMTFSVGIFSQFLLPMPFLFILYLQGWFQHSFYPKNMSYQRVNYFFSKSSVIISGNSFLPQDYEKYISFIWVTIGWRKGESWKFLSNPLASNILFLFFKKTKTFSLLFFKKKDILVVLFEVINPFELLHGVHLILPQDR